MSALLLLTGDKGGTRPISEFLSLNFSAGLHAENERDNSFSALCSVVLQDQGGLVTKVSW